MPEVVEEEGEQQTELPAKASPGENENGGLLANPDKKVRLEQKNKQTEKNPLGQELVLF